MNPTPEKLTNKQEASFESAREAGAERRDQLRERHEKLDESAHEKQSGTHESIKAEALENAISAEKSAASPEKSRPSPATRRGSIKHERTASYKRTMEQVQGELSGPSRAFSKVIHAKAVESVSEVAGATIARPNAILAGAISAFIFTLGLYVIAKHFGYRLSGFETIGAFILGWIVGQLIDFLRIMITGKRA